MALDSEVPRSANKNPNTDVALHLYGSRIRWLRAARGLSQRELARQAGITNGSLSQIENNNVSPSIVTLAKLLEVLSISLSDFFDQTYDLVGFTFSQADFTSLFQNGLEHRILALGRENNIQRHIQLVNIAPNESSDFSWLEVSLRVTGIVQTGVVKLYCESSVSVLNPGDGFNFESRQSHSLSNEAGQMAEIVAFLCG